MANKKQEHELSARLFNETEFFKNNVSMSGGNRMAGSQPQTKLLANQLASHIEQTYGRNWLLYLSDCISLYDLSRLEKLHIKDLMKINKTIKQETKNWVLGNNEEKEI